MAPMAPEKRIRFTQLWGDGVSAWEIAKLVGIHGAARVNEIAERFGLPEREVKPRKEAHLPSDLGRDLIGRQRRCQCGCGQFFTISIADQEISPTCGARGRKALAPTQSEIGSALR